MPTTLTFTINDDELSPADKNLVMESLGKNLQNIQDALTRLGKAAFIEYAHMLSGKGIPTKSQDVVQERLMLLLDHYYNTVPTEDELTTVFQITLPQSKTLIKNFKSKYRTKIAARLTAARKAAVDTAVLLNLRRCFIGTSSVIIDELNDLIRKTNPGVLPIVKDIDAAGKYSCDADTYQILQNLFP
jgi:hypothetical protein